MPTEYLGAFLQQYRRIMAAEPSLTHREVGIRLGWGDNAATRVRGCLQRCYAEGLLAPSHPQRVNPGKRSIEEFSRLYNALVAEDPDITNVEIGQILGLAPTTVQATAARARKMGLIKTMLRRGRPPRDDPRPRA